MRRWHPAPPSGQTVPRRSGPRAPGVIKKTGRRLPQKHLSRLCCEAGPGLAKRVLKPEEVSVSPDLALPKEQHLPNVWQYARVNWVLTRISAPRSPRTFGSTFLLAWQMTSEWPRFGKMLSFACMSPCAIHSAPDAIQLECSKALRLKASNLDTTSASDPTGSCAQPVSCTLTTRRWLADQPDPQALSSRLDVCGLVLEEAAPSPHGGASACHLCCRTSVQWLVHAARSPSPPLRLQISAS